MLSIFPFLSSGTNTGYCTLLYAIEHHNLALIILFWYSPRHFPGHQDKIPDTISLTWRKAGSFWLFLRFWFTDGPGGRKADQFTSAREQREKAEARERSQIFPVMPPVDHPPPHTSLLTALRSELRRGLAQSTLLSSCSIKVLNMYPPHHQS